MKASLKAGKGKRREGKRKDEVPEQTLILRQRLHDALNLGIKFCADKKRKWQCQDVEIMGNAVRLMSTFVGCISSNILQHPLIKDSVSDMFVALEGILQSENETVLGPATNVTERLFLNLGSSIRQYHYSDIVLPLSKLLSFHQSAVLISSAVALKCILSNLGSRAREESSAIWDAIKKTKAVESILHTLQDYISGSRPLDYFTEIASLLKEILLRWPPSRYPAWNDIKLMSGPVTSSADYGSSVLFSILQLYSTLALCGDVAIMISKSKELVSEMVLCMQCSQPTNVRIQALMVFRNLTRSEKGCNLLISFCCESLVQGIIDAMCGLWSSHSRRIPSDRMPLATAACQAALITRWSGGHHAYFWKFGIDHVLHDLLLGDYKRSNIQLDSPDELRAAVYDNITDIRNYIWDILGFLVKHCEDSHFQSKEKTSYVDTLIHCACLVAADLMLMRSSSKYYHILSSCTSEAESVSRAVAMMVFSPCNYIASRTRDILWGTVTSGGSYLEALVDKLRLSYVANIPMASDNLQMVVDLSRLAFYSSLPQFHGLILERSTTGTLSAIINKCINGKVHVHRSSIAPYLFGSNARTCCWNDTEDCKSENIILLYSLQALSQLVFSSDPVDNHQEMSSGGSNHNNERPKPQSLISSLQQILSNNFGDDLKWYAAYCLSSFGFYGFPSSLGTRMERSLKEDEFADLQLILPNGKSLGVHGAILMARCPALLPLEKLPFKDKSLSSESGRSSHRASRQVIHLSSNVDSDALMKLLEYVYTGHCQVDDDMLRPLSILAKRCNVKSLYEMLKRKQPRCGMPVPICNFTQLLTLAGHPFTDVTLEAKDSEETWHCGTCQSPLPHVHVHKIILISSCSYMRALFQSGMQESYSQVLKVPISREALVKLVNWFYSGDLPKLEFHCGWIHMDSDRQFLELLVYLELSWLAEFWCLEDLQRESLGVVISCIEASPSFPLKIIGSAAGLHQHAAVGAAIHRLAPLYPRLRDAGELEGFDEAIVRMLRSEYVHFSQETPPNY